MQEFFQITELCKVNTIITSVTREICRVIDFDQSNIHQRFYPQPGLNEALDRSEIFLDNIWTIMLLNNIKIIFLCYIFFQNANSTVLYRR